VQQQQQQQQRQHKMSELVSGLSTVRAYRKGEALERRFVFLVDRQARTIRASNTLRRWLALRLEVFGAVVVLGVALSVVITEVVTGKPANAALVGLSLSYALKVMILLIYLKFKKIQNSFYLFPILSFFCVQKDLFLSCAIISKLINMI
jgi:ABC-type multidrug transport system fused ATPase/permease subunit